MNEILQVAIGLSICKFLWVLTDQSISPIPKTSQGVPVQMLVLGAISLFDGIGHPERTDGSLCYVLSLWGHLDPRT